MKNQDTKTYVFLIFWISLLHEGSDCMKRSNAYSELINSKARTSIQLSVLPANEKPTWPPRSGVSR